MKTSFISFLCFIFLFPGVIRLAGQSNILGKVTSPEGSVLSYASVLLLNAKDSSFIKGSITNDQGTYVLQNIAEGEYILSATMLGYQQQYLSVRVPPDSRGEVVVKTLILENQATDLAEVQIKARKPLFEQEIDRLVVNVAQSVNFAGNTALEILEKSPWVVVNHQSESFSLAGKNGVFVMINGKLNRMTMSALFQMLSGMPSINIEKIELITTPPAGYDAEGDAGFINIVLKKNEQEGMNGSFSVSAGYGAREKIRPSFTINYRKNKLNIFGDYAFNRNVTAQLVRTERMIDLLDESITTYTTAHRDPNENIHTARLGVDIEVSRKTVIGVLTTLFDRDWRQQTFNEAKYLYSIRPDSSLQGSRTDLNRSQQYLFNLNLQHHFTAQQRLNMDLDYFNYYSGQPQSYANRFFDEQLNLTRSEDIRINKATPLDIWVSSIDYTIDITRSLKLETGLKASFSDFTNEVLVEFDIGNGWFLQPDFSERAGFNEDIGAAYGAFSYEIDSKTSLKAGLRYEYTNTRLESGKEENSLFRKYGNFFPSLFLSRDLGRSKSIQMAYSRRITRPTFNDLAPFVVFLEPNTFVTGNSFLLPALTNQLKVDFQFKTIILSAQYSLDNNAIANFQPKVDPTTNLIIYSSENLDKRETYTLSLNLPVYVNKWWEMQNQILALRSNLQSDHQDVAIRFSQNSLVLSTSQTFNLVKNFAFEIDGFYNTASQAGLSILKPYGAINVGFQKKFEHNGGTLSFNLSDVFRTMRRELQTEIPELNLHNTLDLDLEFRVARLTYTRHFGRSTVKSGRKRKTGSEEERSRVGN